MPLVHHYSENGGYYLGSSEARISPMEPEKYLVPRFATLVDLPEAREGFVRKFSGVAWEYEAEPEPQPEPVENGEEQTQGDA